MENKLSKSKVLKYLLILLFLPIYLFYYLWFKTNYSKEKKMKISLVSLGLIFLFSIISGISVNKSLEEAEVYNSKAESYINSGKVEEANKALIESKKISSSERNRAYKLEKEISTLFNDQNIKKALVEMSVEDYDNLVDGKLSKNYSENSFINSGFLVKLRENSSKRADYIAELQELKEKEEKQEKEKQREEIRWKVLFAIKNYLRDTLNDPDSYKEVSSNFWDFDTYMIVNHTFRAKNAFNATITKTYKFKVSLDKDKVSNIEVVETY